MSISPATVSAFPSGPEALPGAMDWPAALATLRDAGAEINRLGPGTSLAEALQLIAETAVRLVSSQSDDGAAAVIYTYDVERRAFDPGSRVSAGEGRAPLIGDTPRPAGVGATALARRSRVLSYEEPGIAFHPLKYQAGIRTAACYPLLVAGQPVGALYVDLRSDRRFTPAELLLLDTFVHLAAVAIYNTRQFESVNRALQRKVGELERLQRAGQSISSRLDLKETLNEILRAALDLTHAEHGSFRLLDKQAGVLRQSAIAPQPSAGPAQGRDLEVSEHSSVMGWVASHRQPLLITDLSAPPWAGLYRPLLQGAEMRSELAVPLLGSGGALEGVLNVESPRLAAVTPDDQRLLEALATQAVIAIQEAKLLDAIAAVSNELVHRTPDELFALLIERACDLLNVPHAAVWDLDRSEPAALTLRASTGDFPPRYRVPVRGSLLGTTILTRRPVSSPDLRADPRIKRPELVRHMDWASALIVPLVVRQDALRGAFGVYSTEPRHFSDWDTRLLTSLANHAGVALQQAEALAQMKLAEERHAVAETFAVLGDVAANLLHRINNLIGAIPVRIQGLAAKRPALLADDYVSANLADIEDSARAAMAAARETLVFVKPLRLQPVHPARCFRAATARLSVPTRIQLTSAGLEALPPVWAGEEQLRLVFVNLLENAVDALADRPGRIHVSGRLAADALDGARQWVEIAVTDNGPGVPPAMRSRIFEPEFSTKASAKKLGFGLWWAKSWVQRCGGSIELADPVPDTEPAGETLPPLDERGCRFVIRLPLAETGGPA